MGLMQANDCWGMIESSGRWNEKKYSIVQSSANPLEYRILDHTKTTVYAAGTGKDWSKRFSTLNDVITAVLLLPP